MDPALSGIFNHMKSFALFTLGRATCDAAFAEAGSPYAHAHSVVRAAHGAAITIKAMIAKEHPLLVFEGFPKSKTTDGMLSAEQLFRDGRSVMFSEFPERLWATTGFRMSHTQVQAFNQFGYLRNAIAHFAVPGENLSEQTLRFIFGVIEPMIVEIWDETIIDYAAKYDTYIFEFFEEELATLGISVPAKTLNALAAGEH